MAFTARRKPADAAAEEVHERQAVDEDRPYARCEDLARHDQGDDRDQDRANVVVIETLERRDDVLLSTLTAYVRALGGELEIMARFGTQALRLNAASSPGHSLKLKSKRVPRAA